MANKRGPMPKVTYDGDTYTLRSRSAPVPDLDKMQRFDALLWICRNTYPRGYSRPNPLAGLAGAIEIGGLD